MTERRSRGECDVKRASPAAKAIRRYKFNREITTLAISEQLTIDGTSREWEAFHVATVEWNAARTRSRLIAPQAEAELHAGSRVKSGPETAILKQWDPNAFRRERARLGELASTMFGLRDRRPMMSHRRPSI